MENPMKVDDLGVPLFSETPMWVFWSGFSLGGEVFVCLEKKR